MTLLIQLVQLNGRNGSKKKVEVEIPEGKYVVLAENGKADVDGLSAFTGSKVKASATSATILAEE